MGENKKVIEGNIVDVVDFKIFPGKIKFSEGVITEIEETNEEYDVYITPGLIDSHIHIESTMLTPYEFSRIASTHGTVATISDPHEIANVMGIKGVEFMIDDASRSPVKISFCVPSCVPASKFEHSGGKIDSKDVKELIKNDKVKCLGEVMDFPGVLNEDENLLQKIKFTEEADKAVDGHAPGLTGDELKKYVERGIETDHEVVDIDEALEKIEAGMMVQIREGSAAKSFDKLFPILENNYENCMFCTDDIHPNDLVKRHIDELVRRSLEYDLDIFKTLQVASLNPIDHYDLDVGTIQVGDKADFLLVDNLEDFNVLKTYVDGEIVYDDQKSKLPRKKGSKVNNFKCSEKEFSDFKVRAEDGEINVIEAHEGDLYTTNITSQPKIEDDNVVSDIERDILKIVMVNRYGENSKMGIGFVKNFGLKEGAIASSVCHDSHNIVGVGTSDEFLCKAVNLVIKNKGGLSIVSDEEEMELPLPVGGLMSNEYYPKIAKKYEYMEEKVKELGSKLESPFMTLSFMGLTVIPELKITDDGLFDVEDSRYIDIFD